MSEISLDAVVRDTEYQVYVIGALSIDDVTTHKSHLRKIGGAVTYSSLSYLRLGVPTSIVSNFDHNNLSLVEKLSALNISLAGGQGGSTTSFAIHVKGDGRDMSLLAKSHSIGLDDVRFLERLAEGFNGHIHLGPLFGDDIDIASISLLKSKGFLLGMDIQGFVRKIDGASIVTEAHPRLDEVLGLCSYLKADVDELNCLLDHLNLGDAKGLVSKYQIEELIVTAASKGGHVYTKDGWSISYEPDRPELAADSTGAGDVFFATYLCKRLRDAESVESSCKYAQETVIRHLKGGHINQSALLL